MTTVPVLVIDDHELVGATLTLNLRSRGHDAHRCVVGTREQILADAAALLPGIALLDLDLGRGADGRRLDGVDLVADLTADGWRVLVLTGLLDPTRLAAAVAAGAAGFLAKTGALDRLYELLGRLADGESLIPPEERRAWAEEHKRAQRHAARLALLTGREREILDELAAGKRAAAIAASTGVSVTTIRTHIRAILVKLRVSSQLEAVAMLRSRTE